jgi:hypothetical protein
MNISLPEERCQRPMHEKALEKFRGAMDIRTETAPYIQGRLYQFIKSKKNQMIVISALNPIFEEF